MAPAETLAVQAVYCPVEGQADLVELRLPTGATVSEALQASGLLQRHSLQAAGLRFGVWGKACEAGRLLRDRDRVEIYRPLIVDPKEARRQRYQQHRARTAVR